MSMRQSHTAVVERNQLWEGEFATEPYEAGWSHEAIFFVQILRFEEEDSQPNPLIDVELQVQISPDGIHWCDEGSRMNLVAQQHTLDQAVLCARVPLRRLAAPSRDGERRPRLGTRPSGAQGVR